jgi:hypothetical protein
MITEFSIALMIIIPFCVIWVFIFTWQQIGFVKRDIETLKRKNEEFQREVRELDRNIRYKFLKREE